MNWRNTFCLFAVFCLASFAARPLFSAEGRIPISEPTTISASGSYIVTADFSITSGSAIVIAHDHVTVDLDGHTITNNGTSDTITNQGGAADIEIRNGTVAGGGYQIHMTLSSGGQVRIEDLKLVDQADAGRGLRIEGGMTVGSEARAIIQRIVVLSSQENGIACIRVDNARIEQNSIRGSGSPAIYLLDASNTLVTRNSIANDIGGSTGILLSGSSNNLILENAVSRTSELGGSGIVLQSSSARNTIERNNLSGNIYGISVTGGTGNEINNNNISASKFSGIVLIDSSSNHISYNLVSGSAESHGIVLGGTSGGSDYNSLEWNTSQSNGNAINECGFAFATGSSRNIYSYNRALNNGGPCTTCGFCDADGTNVSNGRNVDIP